MVIKLRIKTGDMLFLAFRFRGWFFCDFSVENRGVSWILRIREHRYDAAFIHIGMVAIDVFLFDFPSLLVWLVDDVGITKSLATAKAIAATFMFNDDVSFLDFTDSNLFFHFTPYHQIYNLVRPYRGLPAIRGFH